MPCFPRQMLAAAAFALRDEAEAHGLFGGTVNVEKPHAVANEQLHLPMRRPAK